MVAIDRVPPLRVWLYVALILLALLMVGGAAFFLVDDPLRFLALDTAPWSNPGATQLGS